MNDLRDRMKWFVQFPDGEVDYSICLIVHGSATVTHMSHKYSTYLLHAGTSMGCWWTSICCLFFAGMIPERPQQNLCMLHITFLSACLSSNKDKTIFQLILINYLEKKNSRCKLREPIYWYSAKSSE